MARKVVNQVKLGIFVMAGLAFLVLMLYVIGKNQNLFGKTFVLKARFEDVRGLMPGNNIRFAGIDAGTVKSVKVLNDTTVEVSMLIKTRMKPYIRKNATISISTDGLMGNKLLNIESSRLPAPVVDEGDILYSIPGPDTEDMLRVLNETNNDIAFIAAQLKETVQRINRSRALWEVLDDGSVPRNIRTSLYRIEEASLYLNHTMQKLDAIASDLHSDKSSVGRLLADTSMAEDVKQAIKQFRQAGMHADSLALRIERVVTHLDHEISQGKGSIAALLNDREMKRNLETSIINIEKGTKTFQESMDAVRHSFLFRGYFRKLEKQKKADTAQLRY